MEDIQASGGESLIDIEESTPQRPTGSVNAYGSPVARRGEQNVRVEASGEAIASTSESNRVTCSCKNTCSSKKTAKSNGCPCKNAGLACCTNCKCGTKKSACKNRTAVVVVNRNPSAFARHQEQVAAAKKEIQQFINSLATAEKDQILLRLLTQGRGSLDYAKNLLEDSNSDPRVPEPDAEPPAWCI